MSPMNKQAESVAEPFAGADLEAIRELCAVFRGREDVLSLARQFIQLIKAVQRHRGTSMALLAGNLEFQQEFDHLERELEHRLAYIQAFASSARLLSSRDHENLHNAWLTLSRDWQEDDVIDNFELHSYVLEQLLVMLAGLARELEQPLSLRMTAVGQGATDPAQVVRQRDLIAFVAQQVPQMVEEIARIRGLSTYAISAGECSEQHNLKLRYSAQRVREQSEALQRCMKRLGPNLSSSLCASAHFKAYEVKLMFLLNQVETEVLRRRKIVVSSQQVYALATEIIDSYLRVVDDGLTMVGRWQRESLDEWLRGG